MIFCKTQLSQLFTMAACKLCLNSEAALGLSISKDPSNPSPPEQQRHQLVDPKIMNMPG